MTRALGRAMSSPATHEDRTFTRTGLASRSYCDTLPTDSSKGCAVVKQEDPTAERAWVHIVVSALGAIVTAAVLLALYYLLPLNDLSGASAVSGLIVGIVVFVALISWQVWRILRSDHPGSRALEGLFVAVPLFILLFATAYYLMARAEPNAFTEALSRTDALYLTVTIFSTVRFGDISPQTETARLVVAGQMILDLIVLGVGIKVILGAVQRSRERSADRDDDDPVAS